MQQSTDAEHSGAGALRCSSCQATLRSAAELAEHAIQTGHSLSRCPDCAAVVAPDELVGDLSVLLSTMERRRQLQQEAASAPPRTTAFPPHSPSEPGQPYTVHGTGAGACPKRASAHADSDASAFAGEAAPTTDPTDNDEPRHASAVSYRCMSCLNTFPTWTRLTKHVDSTEHTLAKCVTCFKSLKCYGPLRPHRHTDATGHTGLWGPFYNRSDYAIPDHTQRTFYVSENRFTGHSVLQFECTCGVRFVNEAHLAIHLREAHKVDFIADEAVCTTCGLSGSLQAMATHIVAALDAEGVVAHHELSIAGFSALPFGVYRSLSAIGPGVGGWTDGDPSPQTHEANSGEITTTSSPILASPSCGEGSPFIVLYQCRCCYLLFSTWERMEQHIQITGHCRSYCVDCHHFLPNLRSFGEGEKSRPTPHPTTSGGPESTEAMSTRKYLEHIQMHPNVLGHPVSRESLEVLYHRQRGTSLLTPCTPFAPEAPPASDRLDVLAESQKKYVAARDPVMFAFQCSTCSAVFVYYAELIDHLMKLGHGVRMKGREDDPNLVLESSFPMVSYQVKFTAGQLCRNFGFVQCTACSLAFPASLIDLHRALCQDVWIAKNAAEKDTHADKS